MRTTRQKQILVAGGAGFLASHLCERLIHEGARVVCLDNFLTGSRENLGKLELESGFGWSPATSLEQGLRATIAWFDEGAARGGVRGGRGDEALLTA